MKKASTMRTAVIRAWSINETEKNGTVIYSYADMKNKISELVTRYAGLKYAMITHKAEKDEDREHYHIVLKTKSAMVRKTLEKIFEYCNVESARNINAAIQYLIHKNDPEKTQYNKNEIDSNFTEIEMEKLFVNTHGDFDINYLIDKIGKGDIKEYTLNKHIDPINYTKYSTAIKMAFEYYLRNLITSGGNRKMKVIVIQGDPGTGKTEYAKDIARHLYPNKDSETENYSLSSASNDPFQDYKGQPCVIMDDLRDSAFALTDMLKVLDNYTNSSIKSRYTNKLFIGETIIITTCKPIEKWYTGEAVDEENRYQFTRRINTIYTMGLESVNIKERKDDKSQWQETTIPFNPSLVKVEVMKEKEKGNLGTAINMTLDMVKKLNLTNDQIKELNQKGIEHLKEKNQTTKIIDTENSIDGLPF